MNEHEMEALTSELQEYDLKVICVHIVQASFSVHSNRSSKTSFGQYLNEADHTVHFQQLFCVTKYRVLRLQSSYIHMMEHIYNPRLCKSLVNGVSTCLFVLINNLCWCLASHLSDMLDLWSVSMFLHIIN